MAYRSTSKSLSDDILEIQRLLREQRDELDARTRKMHVHIDKLEGKLARLVATRLTSQNRPGHFLPRLRPSWKDVPMRTPEQLSLFLHHELEAHREMLRKMLHERSVEDGVRALRAIREGLRREIADEKVLSQLLKNGSRSSIPTAVALGSMFGSLFTGMIGIYVGHAEFHLIGLVIGGLFGLMTPLMLELTPHPERERAPLNG